MSHHYHAVVWIDHHEARVIEIGKDEVDEVHVKPHHPIKHLHTKAGSSASWRAPEDVKFFKSVAERLGSVHEVLIVGPANAKTAFVKYLHNKDPKTAEKVVGVETVDHPTDGQLVHYAKAYFKQADRMLPQLD